jgi:mannose-6-phosphate isomerase-like protein (cupin superfamily)
VSGVHDLTSTYVHLGVGPDVGIIPVGDDFWSTLDDRPELHTGRLVTSMRNDADWTVWEMHPTGDELVIVLDGAVRFHLEHGTSVEEVTLHASQFVVVPAGVWHTADAPEPAQLMFVTWGEGTTHRPR